MGRHLSHSHELCSETPQFVRLAHNFHYRWLVESCLRDKAVQNYSDKVMHTFKLVNERILHTHISAQK